MYFILFKKNIKKTLTKFVKYIQYIIYTYIQWGESVRVISGSARGRKLVALSGLDTRPTTDRVKESIFNIIMPYIPARRVLDLFSGSGAMGIEALSRGSESCVFVEKERPAMQVTKQNIGLARLEEKSETFMGDALSYLERAKGSFDVIFLDPPYNTGLLTKAIERIYSGNLLSDEGIIVAECEYMGEEPDNGYFDIIKSARYGKTSVFVLRKKAQTQGG